MIDKLLNLSTSIRYVAIYRDGRLEQKSKSTLTDSSSLESDKYEELLVNPTLLQLAVQRGNIDCGGLDYIILRYGNFFQFIFSESWGHVSICIEKNADPISIGVKAIALVKQLKKGQLQ